MKQDGRSTQVLATNGFNQELNGAKQEIDVRMKRIMENLPPFLIKKLIHSWLKRLAQTQPGLGDTREKKVIGFGLTDRPGITTIGQQMTISQTTKELMGEEKGRFSCSTEMPGWVCGMMMMENGMFLEKMLIVLRVTFVNINHNCHCTAHRHYSVRALYSGKRFYTEI